MQGAGCRVQSDLSRRVQRPFHRPSQRTAPPCVQAFDLMVQGFEGNVKTSRLVLKSKRKTFGLAKTFGFGFEVETQN